MPYHDAYSGPRGPITGAFRMGLRPIALADWLPAVDDMDARIEHRRALLAARPDAHHACPPMAEDAARELLALVNPSAPAGALARPLLAVAEGVPDDICLLSPEQPRRLRAAVLTAASSWRLEDKLDRDLSAIHAPVEGLEQRLGERMRDFMDRLPGDRVFERSNWSLYDDGAWDRSAGGALDRIPTELAERAEIAEHLWLRMERQTLRRLPLSNWIVFTIRIHRHRMTDLATRPLHALHLRAAMASLDDTERRARRLDRVGVGLDAWLARISATALNTGKQA